MNWQRTRLVVATILACNYFAFQIELFEEEYEHNHPHMPDAVAFSHPSLSWESFDKVNAPQAFVVKPLLSIELIGSIAVPETIEYQFRLPYQPIRDKSPPSILPS